MRVWTVSELDNIAASLKPLVGARLQEIQTSDDDLVLGFYSSGRMLWLWVDLNATKPCLLPFTELPLSLPWKKNPLNLFLRAHFVGGVLRNVSRPEHKGRVVILGFDDRELELRLFPHGRNVIARTADKQIAWQKPKELGETSETQNDTAPRGLEELREEWLALRGGKGKAKTKQDVRGRLEAEILKKKKALVKVDEELGRKRDMPWKSVGEWLKTHQSLDVPKEWEPFVDKRRKLSWNIEECYSRARDVEAKLYGTEKRITQLKEEITRLERRRSEPMGASIKEPATRQPLVDAGAAGRTLRLSDELILIAGKSAADNLKLLRKARAWDYWFHMRDVPSSHAILFRNKNTHLSEKVVRTAVEWYVRQQFGQKYKDHAGEKIQVQMAECRFVRPIKGDKLGRVTFQNERVITFQIPQP